MEQAREFQCIHNGYCREPRGMATRNACHRATSPPPTPDKDIVSNTALSQRGPERLRARLPYASAHNAERDRCPVTAAAAESEPRTAPCAT